MAAPLHPQRNSIIDASENVNRPCLQRCGGMRCLAYDVEDDNREIARTAAMDANGIAEDAPPVATGARKPQQPEGGEKMYRKSSTIGDKNKVVLEFSPTLLEPPTVDGTLIRNGTFIRNKVEIDRTLNKLQWLHRQMERMSQEATNCEHTKLLTVSGNVIDILSTLQDTNHQNEGIIKNLQKQLLDLTMERDAARRNSDRLLDEVDNMKEIVNQERLGFALVSNKQKKEITQLKRKVKKLKGEKELTKCQAKEKKQMIMSNEARGGMDHWEAEEKTVKLVVTREVTAPMEDEHEHCYCEDHVTRLLSRLGHSAPTALIVEDV